MNLRGAAIQVGTDVAINLKLSVAGKVWNKYAPTSRIVESVAVAAGTMTAAAKPYIDNVVNSVRGWIKGATNGGVPGGIWDRGQFTPIQRGNLIEDHLAGTDYSGWTRVGSQDNGFSPAFDFNQGSTWVSLKTVDTTGTGWQSSMRSHIDELSTWTSPNSNATKILDIRVQPGGMEEARSLAEYGADMGVSVRINEF